MDALPELRKMVCHHPRLMVGATTFISDDRRQLHLKKPTDNCCGGPPGGEVEAAGRDENRDQRDIITVQTFSAKGLHHAGDQRTT
jgi:hypothetical protein